MQEVPAKADAGEAELLGRCQQGKPVMPDQGDINGNFEMPGLRRAADFSVPSRAPMTRIDHQRPPHAPAQRLERVQE